jgi:hypothetical protein
MEKNKMDYEKYLKERLQAQIDWYSRKGTAYKTEYLTLSTIGIIAASSIPFLVGYVSEDNPWVKIFVGFLGVLIAVITGITALNKSQELWIEYRTTCELLKHQKYLFETGTKPYDEEDAFHFLVENVEVLISKEHSKWSKYTGEKKKEGGKN